MSNVAVAKRLTLFGYAQTYRNETKKDDRKAREEHFQRLCSLVTKLLKNRQPVLYVEVARSPQSIDSSDNVTINDFSYQPARDSDRDCDAAGCAAEAIRYWWRETGKVLYPADSETCIVAHFGKCDPACCQLLKMALQKGSRTPELVTTIHHLPAGISKWRTIDHRLICNFTPQTRTEERGLFHVVVSQIGMPGSRKRTKKSSARK